MSTELEDAITQGNAYKAIINNALDVLDAYDPNRRDCVSTGIRKLQTENRKLWNDLAVARGWKFVSSHDVPSEFGVVAVPDSWVHEEKQQVFDVKECT